MSRGTSAVSEPSRGRRALLMLGMLGLLGVLALAAGWVYVKSRADLTGLEGTWRQQGDASHTFRFKANGNVDAWYQGLLMGNFMTWQRDGRQVTIRSTRSWDFVGQLGEGEMNLGRSRLLNR